ncbi:hypothetical protein MNV49_007535 [Pseudohyphozyma bogoriensis]|nr:hypothetical protein MNV49_007535 [Pseudohyphozyma bogoriensis]
MSTKAILNFVVDETHPKAFPHSFCTVVATGKTLQVAPYEVEIEDVRDRIGKIDIDEMGFAVEKVPAVLEGEGWEDKYTKQTCEWLRSYLGAKRVVCHNYQVRRRIKEDDPDHPKEFDPAKLQPATVVHVDSSQGRGPFRCSTALGLKEEEFAGKRCAVINVWRPLRGPVIDSPLTVCDTRTVDESDITITTDVYGPGCSELLLVDRFRWYYLKNQMPDEILILRNYDSTRGVNQSGVTPHSAFMDEKRMKTEPFELRQSIEVRSAVLASFSLVSAAKDSGLDVSVNMKFPDNNPFGRVSNGHSNNLLHVKVANHAGEEITLTRVFGAYREAEGRQRALRNTTTLPLRQSVLPGLASPLIPYKFHSENRIGEVGLRVWIEYLDAAKKPRTILGYDGNVTIVEPPVNWFDLQLLSVYAFLAAFFAFLAYTAYNYFTPAPVKGKRPRRAPAPATPSTPTAGTPAESGKSYEEDWIPEHVLRSRKNLVKDSPGATSGEESEGGTRRRSGRKSSRK